MMPTSMERVVSEVDRVRGLGDQGIVCTIYLDSDIIQDGSKNWR